MALFPEPEETLLGTAGEIRMGRTTSLEIVERCLLNIAEKENSIRAWVFIDEEAARESAEQRDAEIKAGNDFGPLHGIPIGIKDIINVAGWPTAAGSELLAREKLLAREDAPLVKRLKDAGAVILGKTVTTQFASFDPPVTRNPWNTEHTPGGSSSGSAAAVAAGMCLAAIGSQTGGSITRPASFCGVVGMKPAYGAVPLDGIYPLSPPMDHPGPITRTVADALAIYEVIANTPVLSGRPRRNTAPRMIRLGDVFHKRSAEDMQKALEDTLQLWIEKGATISTKGIPVDFRKVLDVHGQIMARGAAMVHQERFARHPDDYRPKIRSLIETGLSLTETDWQNGLTFREEVRQKLMPLFEKADVLVTPAAAGVAPTRETTGDPMMNSPWSFTGFPTITFPMGLSPAGSPLGIQLIGSPDNLDALFQAALWGETQIAERLT